ncbi:MAG: transcriptional repressor [Acidobacteria bacterium]|nr:transcriptional repressor [Acidobacteriota bacterium]
MRLSLNKSEPLTRRTEERELILDFLPNLPGHFSAEDLLTGLKTAGVSRATVYRTLDFLVAKGILQRVHLGEEGARYELIAGRDRHAHLLCVGCGELSDYPLPLLKRLPGMVARRKGFAVEHLLVRLCGYCRRCRSKKTGKGFGSSGKNQAKRRTSHG